MESLTYFERSIWRWGGIQEILRFQISVHYSVLVQILQAQCRHKGNFHIVNVQRFMAHNQTLTKGHKLTSIVIIISVWYYVYILQYSYGIIWVLNRSKQHNVSDECGKKTSISGKCTNFTHCTRHSFQVWFTLREIFFQLMNNKTLTAK